MEERYPCCLLLILGIPASGKTLLARSILRKRTEGNWLWLGLHFDHFYPPDTRSKASTHCNKKYGFSFTLNIEQGEVSTEGFDLKGYRRNILSSLDMLLSRNSNTSEDDVTTLPDPHQPSHSTDVSKQDFGRFLQYLNAQQLVFDDTGRYRINRINSMTMLIHTIG